MIFIKPSLSFFFLLHISTATVLYPTQLEVDYNNFAPTPYYSVVIKDSPVFSWEITHSTNTSTNPVNYRNITQTYFDLQVSSTVDFSSPGTVVCNIVRQPGQATFTNACNISTVDPSTILYWQVRIYGTDDINPSVWIGNSFLKGLTSKQFFSTFISSPVSPSQFPLTQPVRMRTVIPSSIVSPSCSVLNAFLYVASPAYYKVTSLDGTDLGINLYGAWTEYTQRTLYDVWDITFLFENPNTPVALGFRIGPGPFGFEGYGKMLYNAVALPILFEVHILCNNTVNGQLEEYVLGTGITGSMTYPQERKTKIIKDIRNLNVTVLPDNILHSDWYYGEVIDNTLSVVFDHYDTPAYNEEGKGWMSTVPYTKLPLPTSSDTYLTPHDYPYILPDPNPLKPITMYTNPALNTVTYDFGQNFAGYVQLRLCSWKYNGTIITLSAGELFYENNQTANNQLDYATNMTMHWTLRGTVDGNTYEIVQPIFVFWGFQYVTVTGWPANAPSLSLDSIVGIPISTLTYSQSSSITFNNVSPSATIAQSFVPRYGKTRHVWTETADNEEDIINCTILAGVSHAIVWSQRTNAISHFSDW